jgi:hypothetical protein
VGIQEDGIVAVRDWTSYGVLVPSSETVARPRDGYVLI